MFKTINPQSSKDHELSKIIKLNEYNLSNDILKFILFHDMLKRN